MLVLTRREGEKIFISPNIWITLVKIENGKIRIGIEAPRDSMILRTEIMTEQQKREYTRE